MKLAFKVDVDTYLGTKIGVPSLSRLFLRENIKASFFFTLGEDEMGRSISRVFKKGFLRKCAKSNVLGNYPIRTLLHGTLLPAPIISKRCYEVIASVANGGFECGVHCWNHYRWQNFLLDMSEADVAKELARAFDWLKSICGEGVSSFASAGWQVSENHLSFLDSFGVLYASDSRGKYPFYPIFKGRKFKTMQIPTTLPTLDEILCDKSPTDAADWYVEQICSSDISVMTIHAELEGCSHFEWFEEFVLRLKGKGVEFIALQDYARSIMNSSLLPECEIVMSEFPNRSGLIAVQKG